MSGPLRALVVVLLLAPAWGAASAGVGSNEPVNQETSASTPKAIEVYATYYGWYDNTPPGCATAY